MRISAIAVVLLVCGLGEGVAGAAIVDRVEVAIGNKVITQSDLEQRIRLTSFQNGEAPDFSLESRRQTAQRLIDQRLIEREMELGHYPRIGAPPVDELMASFEKRAYPDSSPAQSHAAMLAALAKYGLTETDLRTDLARQADLLTFLSLRFRPGIDAGADALAERLRADKELDAWLEDQRKRTRIDYPDADLLPTEKAK
jgi:hypothetical protein